MSTTHEKLGMPETSEQKLPLSKEKIDELTDATMEMITSRIQTRLEATNRKDHIVNQLDFKIMCHFLRDDHGTPVEKLKEFVRTLFATPIHGYGFRVNEITFETVNP